MIFAALTRAFWRVMRLLRLDGEIPDLNVQLAFRVLDHRILAGFKFFLRPDLVKASIHFLFEYVHHGRLLDDFVDNRERGHVLDDAHRALDGEFGDAETFRLGKLEVELLLRDW